MFFSNSQTIFKQLERQSSPIRVWPAAVQSIERETCTVKLQGALIIQNIVIPALVVSEPAPDKTLSARPAIGSTVLIGTINGVPDKIMLMQVIEVDALFYQTGAISLTLSSDNLTLSKPLHEPRHVSLNDLLP